MADGTERKILGFNGLRAVAIALVFIQHKARWGVADFGRLGVWLFFALSGFLIIGILHRQRIACEDGQTTSLQAIRRFFYRRTLRIFPIYYLVLAFCALLLAAGYYLDDEKLVSIFIGGWTALLYHAAYLSNVLMGIKLHVEVGLLSHFWSLAVEEQFYLLFAPLLLFLPTKRHVSLCVAALIIGAATQFFLRLYQVNPVFVYTFPVNNFAVMLAGGLGYFAIEPLGSRMTGKWTLLAIPVAVLAAGLFRAFLPGMSAAPLEHAILDVLMIFSCALVVVWIAANQQSNVVRALEWKPIEYIGRISYGFYLYHVFVPNIGNGGLLGTALGLPPDSFGLRASGFALSFAASVFIAHVSWRYIEQPILRLKDRHRKKATVSPDAAIVAHTNRVNPGAHDMTTPAS